MPPDSRGTKYDFHPSEPYDSYTVLYALYVEDGIAYLLMQDVAGQSLERLWPSLQPHERSIILNKLRRILNEMRSLPPPSPPFYGSICHGPLPYFLFWTPETQKTINGPFMTEAELCLGLVERVRQIHTDNSQHMPALTHGDLQKKNIIVTRTHLQNGDDEDDEDGFELTILDWEDAVRITTGLKWSKSSSTHILWRRLS
ncbi:uncharacterized protein PV06_11587 [Exophiala oligosperma]|uniref:Aminoglycoside phosphotransferase domain-containing protein n=1 Tax=Exophiala oligosperma TaxID=215243 RepID=A0A0D2BF42_9EURO|nr:uncharacterized protein PV06_11587 [Exophiala oligosperma]KIW36112.1 hypothetical protein PV06_11587 [Exophiala oligosperma]